ncbi:10025_t:CDS:2, partial [Acaulospora colombiana]
NSSPEDGRHHCDSDLAIRRQEDEKQKEKTIQRLESIRVLGAFVTTCKDMSASSVIKPSLTDQGSKWLHWKEDLVDGAGECCSTG